MDLGLKGRRAIVSGGTREIGRRIVVLSVAEGCDAGFCARDAAEVERAVGALGRGGQQIIGGTADVASDKQLSQWNANTADLLGGLDKVITNASALGGRADEAA